MGRNRQTTRSTIRKFHWKTNNKHNPAKSKPYAPAGFCRRERGLSAPFMTKPKEARYGKRQPVLCSQKMGRMCRDAVRLDAGGARPLPPEPLRPERFLCFCSARVFRQQGGGTAPAAGGAGSTSVSPAAVHTDVVRCPEKQTDTASGSTLPSGCSGDRDRSRQPSPTSRYSGM